MKIKLLKIIRNLIKLNIVKKYKYSTCENTKITIIYKLNIYNIISHIFVLFNIIVILLFGYSLILLSPFLANVDDTREKNTKSNIFKYLISFIKIIAIIIIVDLYLLVKIPIYLYTNNYLFIHILNKIKNKIKNKINHE